MTKRPIVSRRALLAGLSWLVTPSAWAQTGRGNDHGIGGTGVSSASSGDHGIGGTGIVGVIQRFGSIYVNGERISYPADVPVRIDDQPATVTALRVGQLARTVATREANGSLTTRAINVVSEVAGPIDAVGKGEITVLGQRVQWSGRAAWLRPGTEVAVFGLRQTSGTIVASLVDQRPGAAAHVTGVLERDAGGGLHIGALRFNGMTSALVGRRVRIEGRTAQGVMQVARASLDDLSDLAGARRLLIETYARRDGDSLRLGSGYIARNASHYQPATGSEARVVISAMRDGAQGLQIEAVRSPRGTPLSGTAPASGRGTAPHAPGHTPGGARGPGGGSGPGPSGAGPGGPGSSGPGSSGPGSSGPGPSGPGGASGPGGLGGSGGPFGPGGTFGPGGPGGPGGMGGGGFGGGGMGGGRR